MPEDYSSIGYLVFDIEVGSICYLSVAPNGSDGMNFRSSQILEVHEDHFITGNSKYKIWDAEDPYGMVDFKNG